MRIGQVSGGATEPCGSAIAKAKADRGKVRQSRAVVRWDVQSVKWRVGETQKDAENSKK